MYCSLYIKVVSQPGIDAGSSSPLELKPQPISKAAPPPMECSSNVLLTPLHSDYEVSCSNADSTPSIPAPAVLRSTTSSPGFIDSPLAQKNTRRSGPKISHPTNSPDVSSLPLGESGSEIDTHATGMTIANMRIHRETTLKGVEQMETSSPLQPTPTYVPSPLSFSEDLISPREALTRLAGIDPDQDYYDILRSPTSVTSETTAPATSPITSEPSHNLTADIVPGIPDTLQAPLVRSSLTRTTDTMLPLEIRNENSQTSTPFTTDRTMTVEAPDISQLPPSYMSPPPDLPQQVSDSPINARFYDTNLDGDWLEFMNQDTDWLEFMYQDPDWQGFLNPDSDLYK